MMGEAREEDDGEGFNDVTVIPLALQLKLSGVTMNISINPNKRILTHIPTHTQLKNNNISTFRRLLKSADYSSVLSTTDANEAYDKFMNICKSLLEISCRVKMITLHRKYIRREQ